MTYLAICILFIVKNLRYINMKERGGLPTNKINHVKGLSLNSIVLIVRIIFVYPFFIILYHLPKFLIFFSSLFNC